MDCEKFDLCVMDALYDELDELTLAAAKRHMEGCTRCTTAWLALKATRTVGVLPLVEVPADLEDRILRAAERAQAVVPWPKRIGRAVSWAASYAMQPQTQMAAVVLLMVGGSFLLIRPKPIRTSPAQVSVTERGVPAHDDIGIVADRPASLDDSALARAHGAQVPAEAPRAAASAVASDAPSLEEDKPMASAIAIADTTAPPSEESRGSSAKDKEVAMQPRPRRSAAPANAAAPGGAPVAGAAAAGAAAPSRLLEAKPAADNKGDLFAQGEPPPPPEDFASPPPAPVALKKSKSAAAGALDGVAMAGRDEMAGAGQAAAGQAATARRRPSSQTGVEVAASSPAGPSGAGGGKGGGAAQAAPAATAAPTQAAQGTQDGFQAAMALYNQGRYAEAGDKFDQVAAGGGPKAALAAYQAALSVQASSGCANAVGRFETVASRYAGTATGNDALWGAAKCQGSLGNVSQARAHYIAVSNVPAFRERADQALKKLDAAQAKAGQVEASKGEQRAPAKPAAPASPPAAASPPADSNRR